MVAVFGIALEEAVARVNRHWSRPVDNGREPRVWIVGTDIVYHEAADFWAQCIYYGPDPRWWIGRTDLTPLPPP